MAKSIGKILFAVTVAVLASQSFVTHVRCCKLEFKHV